MEFARPAYVYLLVIVPLVAILSAWAARRKQTDVSRLGTPALIASLSASVSSTRRRLKSALWFAALTALVIALARPRWGTQVQLAAQRGVHVMVALDVSASMMAEDIKPNRLMRAKLTVSELMDQLGGNELGLVLFAGAAFIQTPLTADINTAQKYLDAAGPWSISRPGTALDDAIRVAVGGFRDELASNRVILLLTDGEDHEGKVLAAASEAADAGVIVYAIGFGSPEGEPIPMRDESGVLTGYRQDANGETVLSRLNETTLRQMATESGGLYYRASGSGEEISAIISAIAALDTSDIESQFETHSVERFQWFVGLAMVALAAEFLLSDRANGVTIQTLRVAPFVICIIGYLFSACAPEAVRWNNTGNDYFDKEAFDEAIAEYRRAQIADPDRAELYYNSANAYNRQARLDSALNQTQQALKTAGLDLTAQSWYNLGNAFFDVEKWPEAIAAYQEALRIHPEDLDAKHNLELAILNLEEQPQEDKQSQNEQENQQSGSNDPSESESPTPSPETREAEDQPQGEAADEANGKMRMTPEQAIQMLEALVGDSETLQERLKQIFRVPGPLPEKDW